MLLADSNIWLALALSEHEFHLAAKTWLGQRGSGEALFCRATQQTFLRLLTTKAIVARYLVSPLSNKTAWSIYDKLLADSRIGWAEEPSGLEPYWRKFATRSQASPKLWMDAYLAAFAVVGKHKLVTTDKAFRQFKGLDVHML